MTSNTVLYESDKGFEINAIEDVLKFFSGITGIYYRREDNRFVVRKSRNTIVVLIERLPLSAQKCDVDIRSMRMYLTKMELGS
jgi:hypothetical protein